MGSAEKGKRGLDEAPGNGKKAKAMSLKEQEKWMREMENLTKTCKKLSQKLSTPEGQSEKRKAKFEKARARLNEMKAIERRIAEASCPMPTPQPISRPFALKRTPVASISRTVFDSTEVKRRAERQLRFIGDGVAQHSASKQITLQEVRMALQSAAGAARTGADSGWSPEEGCVVYGTSTQLEKPYFRLTSAPAMSSIRPPKVLKKALALAKDKWRDASANPGTITEAYAAFCEQMKSIRQDLTVQHLRSPLTVTVYETHARVALEVGDIPEYTQCASCLQQLYLEGIPGNEPEFLSYRLLTAAIQGSQALSIELLALSDRKRSLLESPQQVDVARHECVVHALDVCSSVCSCNFYRFFALYSSAPRMSAYLMDMLLNNTRRTGLATIVASYGTDIDVSFVRTVLGFETVQELQEFASSHGVVVDLRRGVLDPRASRHQITGPEAG